MKLLVIGANGMIGSTMFHVLSQNKDLNVFGSVRSKKVIQYFSSFNSEHIISCVDVEQQDSLVKTLDQLRPDVVINCAGLTKHKINTEDPLLSIPINTLIPHRLARICKLIGTRLIHVSTDCVFSGKKGNYIEEDFTDACDVYGKSKALGEVNYSHTITLRTSTIGHEIESTYGLLDWFLSQEGKCKGYTRAIFSGLPTVVFAQIVRDVVVPHKELSGLYHIASKPINKFDLLKMISDVYMKKIDIVPDDNLIIDRSLNSEKFKHATGYYAPEWPVMIEQMHKSK